MKLRAAVATVAGIALVVGVLALPAVASSPWTGYGAKLSDWAKAHPKNLTGCSAGTCYGGRVKVGGELTDQFITVQTVGSGHRVIGYEQGIGDGTPLASAKSAVLALFPSDTRTVGYWLHNGGSDDSCVMWNVQSPTLGRLLGDKHAMEVGIELDTLGNGGGYATLRTSDVNDALVTIAPVEKSNGC